MEVRVRPDPSGEGSQQHVVEICNFVDAGTSMLLSAHVHEDFHAATALEAVISFLRDHGRPARMSFDHDPRWVGSSSGWDFPSALQRFLMAVGVGIRLCPPHQPQTNAFVERYHRNYKYECLLVHIPQSLEEVHRVTEAYQQHYNEQRPRKATSLWQPAAAHRVPHSAYTSSFTPGGPG